MFARDYAEAGDNVCCIAMLVDAALCTGHAHLGQRRELVLNDKRLLDRAGLADIEPLISLATTPHTTLLIGRDRRRAGAPGEGHTTTAAITAQLHALTMSPSRPPARVRAQP